MGKKKASPRETSVHELRGTISEMLNPDKRHSELDDEMDSLDRAIRLKNQEIDQKVNAAYKLKKMEQSGMFSKKAMQKAKKDMGIEEDDEVAGDTQDSSYGALAAQIGAEPDANKREALTQQLVVLNVYKEMKGRPQHEIQTAVNNVKASYVQVKPVDSKTEDFKDKMLGKFMDRMLAEKKSDIESFNSFADMVKKVQEFQPQSQGLKEVSETMQAYKKMGFIKDQATTIEEAKLEVDKLKINKEFELKEKEIDSDNARTKSLTDVTGNLLEPLIGAIGAATNKSGQSKAAIIPPVRQETLANAMNATCVTPACGAKILVTNIDQSREIKCGSCGQKYVFDAGQKKLFVAEVEQPGPGNPPGPALDSSGQDTSQSTTA